MPFQPAPLPEVRFFVDADLMALGKALAQVRRDVTHPGHHRSRGVAVDTADSKWLPIVGEAKWVVISRNKRIRHNPVENRLLQQHRVRAIFLTSGRPMTSWDTLVLIVRNWAAIDGSFGEPGPWVKSLTRNGLVDLKMTGPRA